MRWRGYGFNTCCYDGGIGIKARRKRRAFLSPENPASNAGFSGDNRRLDRKI